MYKLHETVREPPVYTIDITKLVLTIRIKTIPHRAQQYDTVGNYWRGKSRGGEVLEIRVSRMADRRYEFLVALHELIEAFLCDWRRISYANITAFDIGYEKARRRGDPKEPGEAPDAPYRREHRFAECLERLAAHELGVEWANYDRAVQRL